MSVLLELVTLLRSEANCLLHQVTIEDCDYATKLIQTLIEACAGNYKNQYDVVQLQIVEILNLFLIVNLPSDELELNCNKVVQ